MNSTSNASTDATAIPQLNYRRFRRPFDPRWRFMTGFTPSPRRVLDVGCGRGQTLQQFAEVYPGIELHGVDRMTETPAPIHYTRLDLDTEPLPYPDNYFDVIVMTHVIEHLCHPTFMAGEIGRVLAPGGWFYVEAPNWVATVIPGATFWDNPTHVRPWSPNGFNSLLKDYAGLRVHAIGVRRHWVRLPVDFVRAVLAIIGIRSKAGGNSIRNVVGWSCFGIGQKPL